MPNGIDRGFCLLYSRLSYRRKFIRTCWFLPICIFLVVLMQATSYLPESLRDLGVSHATEVGWGFVTAFIVLFLAQTAYTFQRWQREKAALVSADA